MEGEKARTSNQNEHPTLIPKSISIFTLNTFLIPSWIAFWSKDNASCAKQDDRAEQIGKFAKDKDLVVLQEVWGSQVDKIESQLRPSHTFLLGYESWSLFGYGSTLFTSAKFQYHQNGGLLVCLQERIMYNTAIQTHIFCQWNKICERNLRFGITNEQVLGR